ncbi:MAG: hypothetical protein ACTHJM_01320 [Marmoricola sp.]
MAKRTSVTLDPLEEAAVEEFSVQGPGRDVLAELGGVDLSSEASVVRALIRVGSAAVRERMLDVAYADMAVELGMYDTERSVLTEDLRRREARRRD